MTVSVSVSTPDAAPTAAPYKVSQKSGYTDATVAIDVTGTGPVRAYKLKADSNSILFGTEIAGKGGICGLSRCGAFAPTAIPTPAHLVHTIPASKLTGEGAHQMGVYVYRNGVFE